MQNYLIVLIAGSLPSYLSYTGRSKVGSRVLATACSQLRLTQGDHHHEEDDAHNDDDEEEEEEDASYH